MKPKLQKRNIVILFLASLGITGISMALIMGVATNSTSTLPATILAVIIIGGVALIPYILNKRIKIKTTLRTSLLFPPSLPVEQFINDISDVLNAISFIYSVFAILVSEKTNVTRVFINDLKEQKNLEEIPLAFPSRYLHNANLQPLRISSMHYGSPASFDLLGIGSALEVLRDILKDVTWRGKHEREFAELERRSKQADIISTRLGHEKTVAEIAMQKAQIDKARLENEKLLLDIALQKLVLAQKTNELKLSDYEKRLIIDVLMPKMELISKNFIAETPINESTRS